MKQISGKLYRVKHFGHLIKKIDDTNSYSAYFPVGYDKPSPSPLNN